MCRAMIDRAQESNPGKTVFTKNELEEAHAKARKELGGGDSLSEKQFRNELISFIRQGFLEEVLSASGKAITRNCTKSMTTKRTPHAQWQ